jgi:hypothetical protein
MRTNVIILIFQVFFLVFATFNSGCQKPVKAPEKSEATDTNVEKFSIYSLYTPVKIDIIPLTELVRDGDAKESEIKLYVSLLDGFSSQIKSPCVFRFELYLRIQRSAELKGKRIVIWPDVDLTSPDINNQHWRDFLRSYEFNLPFESTDSQSYVLQVTCLFPNNRRLSDEIALNTQ